MRRKEYEKTIEEQKNEANNIIKRLPVNIDQKVRNHLVTLYSASKSIRKNKSHTEMLPKNINELINKQSYFNFKKYHGSCGSDKKCQKEKAKAYQYFGCTIENSDKNSNIKNKVEKIKNKAGNHANKADINYKRDCSQFNGKYTTNKSSIARAAGGKKTIKKKSTTKKPVKKTTTKKTVKKTKK